MLNNKQIAARFDILAKIMELHGENKFKINSYANAFVTLRKWEGNLAEMSRVELESIPGVGKNIADKIQELLATGELSTLNKYLDVTPDGVVEMLTIKGLGPKKVEQIWREMGIETVGELLYACQENRLINFKGFGPKMQEDIIKKLDYHLESKGKYLYAHIEKAAHALLEQLNQAYPQFSFLISGDIKRCLPEVKHIEVVTNLRLEAIFLEELKLQEGHLYYSGFPVQFVYSEWVVNDAFARSCSDDFLKAFDTQSQKYHDEFALFTAHKLNFIPSEYRESALVIERYKEQPPQLMDVSDFKGIIHNHSTYSDGLHTLEEMSDYVKACGYDYFVISDHSQTASYAQGLTVDRVRLQWNEIDRLNAKYGDSFRIYKGIESDILTDGRLDYPDEILEGFDVVIASVHSVLNMDEPKATERLIRAIENPYTKILGHPTGRLLLARPGYPIDYKKVIDACAANNVVMELNANPQRLDIDWTWIPYCMEKGVIVSINPDAHTKESIHYIKYGTLMARKGGLTKDMCLNAYSKNAFEQWMR